MQQSSATVASHIYGSVSLKQTFVPAGAVTGIGSLPLACTKSAIRAVAEFSPEIPFWPQLPRLSTREAAIGQGLGILADLIQPREEGYGYQVKAGRIDSLVALLHRSSGQLTSANAAGFGALEEALASGLFPSAAAVKGQIEGPITLAAYLFYKDRPFLSDPALFAAIAFHVSQIICWQIDRLKSAGLPVLLFLDEPALCLEPSDAKAAVSEEQRLNALAVTLDDARARGAMAGLHCCAARPFERMCRVRPDIISFDAHEGLELFFSDPHARQFTRNGGIVAYGMVPTWQCLDALDATTLFTRWLTFASVAGDPQELARRAMITATCGLGLLDESAVAASFKLAHGVGKLIGSLAGER
ncbi:MAG: hypothetical protein JWO80_6014 [Bryobacterales bacterium]|nr:hypothetical protein [Bryobacterales bacterium]